MKKRSLQHMVRLMILLCCAAVCPLAAPAQDFQQTARQANIAREAGKRDEAIALYRQALAQRGDWMEGWWYLGTLSYDADRYADAAEALEKVTKGQPELGAAWSFLGLSQFELKQYDAARLNLEKGSTLGNDDADLDRIAKFHLALLYLRSGELDRARGILLPEFLRPPVSPQVRSALGVLLLRLPMLPQEVDASREAILVAAGDVLLRAQSAGALTNLSGLREALQRAEKPVKNELLARVYEALQQPRQAEQLRAEGAAGAAQVHAFFVRAESAAAGASAADATREWSQAMQAYSTGKYAEAIVELKPIVERFPENGTAWAVLGLSEYETGEYDSALLHLQRGETLGFGGSAESLRTARYHLAILLIHKGDFARATQVLAREAGGSAAPTPEIALALGMAFLRVRALPEDVAPGQQTLLRRTGEAAAALLNSKYDEALPRLRVLLTEFPAQPFLHYVYGSALASLSLFDEASLQFLAETRISPRSELPLVELASLKLQERKAEEAVGPAQRAVTLAPDSASAHYVLGRARLETGKTDAGVAELLRAAELSPNSPEIHFQLARAYARQNEPQKAAAERAIFARLNAAIEQQRGASGSQAYGAVQRATEAPGEAGATPPNP
ncbi:MAG TPA: tetratricopeptide repeat protein [Dongiaceae bacterium]|nr:tetratricopeptide repeat protein [Dongiaceae bacterium]